MSEIITNETTAQATVEQPVAPPPSTAQEATASAANKKDAKAKKSKWWLYLILLLVIIFVTNPQAIPFLPEVAKYSLSEITNKLFGDMSSLLTLVSFNIIGIVQVFVMALVLLFVREIVLLIFSKIKPKTGRGKTLQHLFLSSLQYLLFFVGLFWGLSLLGVNVSTLFASIGVLALIVGFGAESLIADVVTGCFMIVENQYNVGDIIEIEGYRGTVSHTGIRTTGVTDTNGNEKIFNNGDVRNIINLSVESSYAICDIPIPYEANLNSAKAVVEHTLEQLAIEQPHIFLKAPEFLGVQELTNEAVLLRVRASVSEKNRYDAARTINWVLKIALEEKGMGVPHSSELKTV